MKKKIIWGIVIVVFIGIVAWFDLPYLVPTKNLISNQDIDYTYERISFKNWTNYDTQYLEVRDEKQMKNIIGKLDDLKLRRTREFNIGEYELSFLGSYKNSQNMTMVEEVFTINFSKVDDDNILRIDRHGNFKGYSYKILDKDFDIESFIKELKGEQL